MPTISFSRGGKALVASLAASSGLLGAYHYLDSDTDLRSRVVNQLFVKVECAARNLLSSSCSNLMMLWGDNGDGLVMPGQLSAPIRTPIIHALNSGGGGGGGRVRSVAVGEGFAVAADSQGTVWCWGKAIDGNTANSEKRPLDPTLKQTPEGFYELLAGHDIVQVVATRTAAICLGSNGKIAVIPVHDRARLKRQSHESREEKFLRQDVAISRAEVARTGPSAIPNPEERAWWMFWRREQLPLAGAPTSASLPELAYWAAFRNGVDTSKGRIPSKNVHVRQIAAGLDHVCALTQDGAIWTCSLSARDGNRWGQLGRGATAETKSLRNPWTGEDGDTNSSSGFKLAPQADTAWLGWPKKESKEGQETGVIDFSEEETLKRSKADAWYMDEFRRIEGIPPIQTVACGWHHTLALTKPGDAGDHSEVYAWGSNESMQSGAERHTAIIPFPEKVSINGGSVQAIAAGAMNSFFAVQNQSEWRLLALGNGLYGQMGNGQYVHQQGPGPATVGVISGAKFYDDAAGTTLPRKIRYVSAGRGHVAAALEGIPASTNVKAADDVFTWGLNRTFQLGTGRHVNEPTPVSPNVEVMTRASVIRGEGEDLAADEKKQVLDLLIHNAGVQLQLPPGARITCQGDLSIIY